MIEKKADFGKVLATKVKVKSIAKDLKSRFSFGNKKKKEDLIKVEVQKTDE